MKHTNATYFFDFEAASIQAIIEEFKEKNLSPKQQAMQVYLKVRDGWRYNPYYISFEPSDYRASHIAQKTDGHCIDKAILLLTCLRGLGIPARIHFAKVKNHIAVERLIELFGTNELTPHGIVDIFLDGKWLKVSPAFNAELCDRYKVAPLDFDGENDSLLQEYNSEGKEFMEYIEDYGYFDDLPLDFIAQNMKEHYPIIATQLEGQKAMQL